MYPQSCLEATNSFGLLLFRLAQNLADTRTRRERERERASERKEKGERKRRERKFSSGYIPI
jgi:hypothetical protein